MALTPIPPEPPLNTNSWQWRVLEWMKRVRFNLNSLTKSIVVNTFTKGLEIGPATATPTLTVYGDDGIEAIDIRGASSTDIVGGIRNTQNSATAGASWHVTTEGDGDAIQYFQSNSGAYNYSIGVDTSDSGRFKICRSVSIGTNDVLEVTTNGNVILNAAASGYALNLPTKTPSSATDTGTTGDISWDSGFLYVCTATNTWKRVAIATW